MLKTTEELYRDEIAALEALVTALDKELFNYLEHYNREPSLELSKAITEFVIRKTPLNNVRPIEYGRWVKKSG